MAEMSLEEQELRARIRVLIVNRLALGKQHRELMAQAMVLDHQMTAILNQEAELATALSDLWVKNQQVVGAGG